MKKTQDELQYILAPDCSYQGALGILGAKGIGGSGAQVVLKPMGAGDGGVYMLWSIRWNSLYADSISNIIWRT